MLVAVNHFPGLVNPSELMAFITIFFMAYRPVRDLGDSRGWWLKGQEALERLEQLYGPPVACADSPVPLSPHLVETDQLEVPGQSPAVSLRLEPGKLVALAGPTGSGKTSLLRAIMGLEPAAVGKVLVDGCALAPGQVGPRFRRFAWVPQDAPVVSGNLDSNLRLAAVDPPAARLALEQVGAPELQRRLESQPLGAAGRTLSGGERRWVALARAVATGWPVLVLDEPTVGLDDQARRSLLQSIEHLKAHRSVLVATHDRDLLTIADHVVWLTDKRPGEPPAREPAHRPVPVDSVSATPRPAAPTLSNTCAAFGRACRRP